MKQFLKDNWFKIGILIMGLIITYSLFYVLVIEPQNQENKKLYEDTQNSFKKSLCVSEAEQSAIEQYANSDYCKRYAPEKCKDGKTYLIVNYDSYYERCLQREGLK